jgi:pheromone shutdown protein TraB
MLEDTQRKILWVLYHLYQQQWVRPDIDRVSHFSQRSVERVREAIKALRAAGFVEIAEGKMRILIPEEPELQKAPEPPKSAYSSGVWFD